MEGDADLRAPLPPEHPFPDVAIDGARRRVLRSVLCRMFVASDVMRMGTEARFTSLVLFHRYYFAMLSLDVNRMGDEDRGRLKNDAVPVMIDKDRMEHLSSVAAACLFLGCKAEEEHRRIRDVINLSYMLDFSASKTDGGVVGADDASLQSSQTMAIHIHEAEKPPQLDESYWETKEKIVATEQSVLRMIRFDVVVSHPHRAVLLILDGMGIVTKKTLLREAWTLLNNALFYPPALRQPLLPLACGAICLAAEKVVRDISLTLQSKWWDAMGVTDAEMDAAKKSLKDAIDFL